ncbi:hypothetical protein FF124_13995 [Martelella lutilitoris]|uniref:Uncharacterized protein n=1 Tax=Martelella lutilitoris TaxID=2583532 RepID=A0A5C4JPP7_9HYPH|nr:hypothetical protein [Martelella lutilitoris]TNB47280.1 hypothetical protein FF124_13995 [Martelella lutilitoris]
MTGIIAIGGTFLLFSLILSVVLAFFRLWAWSAVFLVMPAVPLQLLGFTGTCTQGADGPFVTGAVLSSPLLASAIGLVLWGGMAKGALSQSGAIVVAVMAMILLFSTRDAWFGALYAGTPCGADYDASHWQEQVLVIGGYLVLPVFLLVSACRAVLPARGKGASGSH